jgi:hypothetical protein
MTGTGAHFNLTGNPNLINRPPLSAARLVVQVNSSGRQAASPHLPLRRFNVLAKDNTLLRNEGFELPYF